MTFNEKLTARVRAELSGVPKLEEKRMFGGVAFMVDGKLCVSVRNSRIMCRVDPEMHEELVQLKGCRTMTMKGRKYKGYVLVDEDVLRTRGELHRWVKLALDFNKNAKASK
ncbi:MAG: TfoX/Sxy family protein [Thaumarchaeota archaeon]|nr:TfoX/Sxy family protein [Nitrososphaerota archaeon]